MIIDTLLGEDTTVIAVDEVLFLSMSAIQLVWVTLSILVVV